MRSTFGARRSGVPLPAEELASQPNALFWAEHCGWVPGTGHCRDRKCSPDCIFRPQRLAEVRRIARERRRRRERGPSPGEPGR